MTNEEKALAKFEKKQKRLTKYESAFSKFGSNHRAMIDRILKEQDDRLGFRAR
jgi:hypothetical protein